MLNKLQRNLIPAFLLFFVIVSCTNEEKVEEESFKVIQTPICDTNIQREFVAEILSVQQVEIRTRVGGVVEKIWVDEGQFVNEGQILFSVSSKLYEQELKAAQASLKIAIAESKAVEIEKENTKRLRSKNIVSQTELDMVNAKAEAANAKVHEETSRVEHAKLSLEFVEIKAPFPGSINRIPNKVGSLVQENDVLTSISNNKEIFAYFNLSESDYLNYKDEKKNHPMYDVDLVLANNKIYPHKGTVENFESEFDQSTGNIAVRVRFPNPEGLLKHGSNGKIIVKKKISKARLVPQQSTFEVQDKLFVFVLGDSNKVVQRQITSKWRIPHYYILDSGLGPNDYFVYEGTQYLRHGDIIKPEKITAQQILKQ